MFRKIILICYAFLAVTCISTSNVSAADCKAIIGQAESTSSLLEKNKILGNAIEQCNKDPDWNYAYAYSLERLRKYSEAANYYKKAISTDSKNPKYYVGLGDVLKNSGSYAEAAEAYKNALRLNPNDQRLAKELEALTPMIPKKEVSQPKMPETQEIKPKEPQAAKEIEKPVENIAISIQQPFDKQICSLNATEIEKQKNLSNMTEKYINELKQKNNMDMGYFTTLGSK
jgi:tetratricopeptide (TPR) repeat protein